MPREIEVKKSIINGLQYHQYELPTLAELAGLKADPAVYRILIELLSMQIDPEVIYKLLRCIKRSKNSVQSNSAGTTKAKTEK